MEEILDIYKLPYHPQYPVICMDESSKQLIEEIREPLSMKPGEVKKFDTEYKRHGTASIFMAFEPLQGLRFTKITDHRTRIDWASYIREIVDSDYYKKAEKIIFVMDNLNTHHKSSLYEAFDPVEAKRVADRFEIHYTPKHGSWLNMAEIELSHLSRQCLDRRISQKDIVDKEVKAWTKVRNEKRIIADWQFTTADARIKLKKLYPTI